MKNIILLLTALLMSCHVMAQETIVTGTELVFTTDYYSIFYR